MTTNSNHSSAHPEPNKGESQPGDDQKGGDVDQLTRQLAEHQLKLDEMRDLILRERADLDNQRKRMVRDLEQARKFANERILSDLLPVCDDLERGLSVTNADAVALRSGMDLTLKTLIKVAESNGLKQINPVGQAFNPEQHQAISLVEGASQAPDTVVAVVQKGYLLNDRLLRPALVTVAKP